jgi:[ribosomal protein S5]-alanine N-acetyltransferase
VDPNIIIEGNVVALHGLGRLGQDAFLDLRQRNKSFWAPFHPPSAATLLPEAQPQLMQILAQMWQDQASFLFGVVDENDALVGLTALEHVNWAPPRLSCEIGFEIDRDHLRRGYATDAVGLALGVAFNDLSMHRVQGGVRADNAPSIALLEKLGFKFEGVARDWLHVDVGWMDHHIYAMLDRDWHS